MIDRRRLLAGTLACGLVQARRALGMASAPSGIAGLPVPPSHALGFRLIRHGEAIGSHTLDFAVEGDTLTIQIAVDVLFTLGPIPLVRYTHHTTEVWRGGRLASLGRPRHNRGSVGRAGLASAPINQGWAFG